MDIFFSGSIRGGRDDQPVYARLVDTLAEHGTVLSEHVGQADVEAREAAEGLTDEEIHDQDVAWLRRADAVVAEVSTPSLGVGYELGRAVAWETPVCCLYRRDAEHALSAMVRGNDAVELVEYDDVDAARRAATAFLDGL